MLERNSDGETPELFKIGIHTRAVLYRVLAFNIW